MVEWKYGNWESSQFAFPLLMIVVGVVTLKQKNEQGFKHIYLSLVGLIVVSIVFCSGMLGPLFSKLPVLSSMHANPRWNLITILPLLYLAVKGAGLLKDVDRKVLYTLIGFALFTPFLHIDKANLQTMYHYNGGRSPELNRLVYCYEPIFGYRLEEFPIPGGKVDFLRGPLMDPRCYLQSSQCRAGSPLPEPETKTLESYRLR